MTSLFDLADDFDRYREREGNGDADAGPHRKDDPAVIDVMRGSDGSPSLWHESHNQRK